MMTTRWIVSVLLFISLLTVSLIFPPSQTAVAQDDITSATAFTRFFLWPNSAARTYNATVQVDAAGGVHTAFYGKMTSGATIPVYYAYCPSGCTDQQRWTAVVVGELGAFGERVILQVTPSSKPRLMWFYQAGATTDGEMRYAECDSACTTQANWKWVKAAVGPFVSAPGEAQFFALDHLGRPRFTYSDSHWDHEGTFYRSCDSTCTTAANWKESTLTTNLYTFKESLAFTTSGVPKLAMRVMENYTDYLTYAECTANCSTSTPTWKFVNLFPIDSAYEFSLRLTSTGLPRMALYKKNGDNRLYYYSCDTTCTTASNWKNYALNLPANMGRYPALALNSNNRPHISYTADDASTEVSGPRYGRCTANCETSSATWTFETVETTSDLQLTSPIPPENNCNSIWLESGQKSSLALSPENTPVITYVNKHVQSAPSGCSLHTDLEVVRIAVTSWSQAKPYKSFLPGLLKN